MEDFHIEGIVAATFTPMTRDGEVDYEKIEDYCQFLFDEGVQQVYINGSTGEGPSLTTDERKRLTECWVKAGRKGNRLSKIIVQVGGTTLKDTILMARHAAEQGVDAISTLPPIYFPVSSINDLVDHCKQVAAAAPATPFYYYHIPIRTGVNLDMSKFLLAARDVIPNLRGVKFSCKDLVQMSACVRTLDARGRCFNVLFGCDEQLMSALVLGAHGAIGSTYNWMAGLFRRMMALLDKGDILAARAEQYRSQDVVQEMFRFGEKTCGALSPMKALMSLAGLDIGGIRPPMKTMDPKDCRELFEILKNMGFLDWRKE